MRAIAALLALALTTAAAAQTCNPAIDALAISLRSLAAMPPVCTSAPVADTLSGTAGSSTTCLPRRDNARATQVMPAKVVTAADGSFAGAWPVAFPSAPTTAFAQANTTAGPYSCQVGSWTATTFTGKCWAGAQVVNLPSVATSLLGLQLAINPPASAGIAVSVVGRQ